MRKIILAGIASIISFSALADSQYNHWVKFNENKFGTLYYNDWNTGKVSFKNHEDRSPEVLILYDSKTEHQSTEIAWKFDCKHKLISEDYETDFEENMAGGPPVEGKNDAYRWAPIVVTSDQQMAIFHLACPTTK